MPCPGLFVGQGEDPVVEIAFGKVAAVPQLQALVNSLLAHVDAAGDAVHCELGLAGQIGVVADEIPVQGQGLATHPAYRRLEGRIAARVPARIEVGEAIEGIRVVGGIAEDVFGAKPDAAPTSEHLVANGLLHGIGVATGVGFGKGDAHLHGTAGAHRVEVAKELLAHGDAAYHVFEDLAHLPLGAKLVDTLGIALAGGGLDGEGRAHHELGDQQLAGPGIDLLPGNLVEVGHHGVRLIGRLLLSHRQHAADVVIAHRQPLGGERRHHVIGPARLVHHAARQEAHDAALHIGRFLRLHRLGNGAPRRRRRAGRGGRLAGTTRQQGKGKQ